MSAANDERLTTLPVDDIDISSGCGTVCRDAVACQMTDVIRRSN